MNRNGNNIEFLQDQVNRLNNQLANYHAIYANQLVDDKSNQIKVILDSNSAPLLTEYDKVIYELKEEIGSFKILMEENHKKVKTITNENERLWSQINSNGISDVISSSNSDLVINLEKQLDTLRKENLQLQELQKVSEEELDRLQSNVDAMQSTPEAILFSDQLETLKRQHMINTSELEHEITKLKDKNREWSYEFEKLKSDYLEIDKEYKMLQEKIKFDKESNEENLSQLKMSLKRIEFLEEEKSQLQSQLQMLKDQVRNSAAGNGEWSNVMKGLENRIREKDGQIFEMSDKMNEMQRILENAISEKKEAEVREGQQLNECDRLRGVIAGVVDDAGVKAREEIENIKANYEKEVERIVEELNYCEQNRQELIAEIDQVKRSKSQLEHELEQFHRAGKERDIKEQSTAELYQERCVRAEREKEAYRLELDQLKMYMEKQRDERKSREEYLEIEVNQLRNKLSQLQTTCDKSSHEVERYCQLLQQTEESNSSSKKSLKETLKCVRHEYELFKQAAAVKQRELETRLTALDKSHRQSQDEMRLILVKQQQLNDKWKSEAHAISEQYDDKIQDASKEIDRLKRRNEEMNQLLQESKQKLLESEERIYDQSKVIENLENKVFISKEPILDNEVSEGDSSWKLIQLKKQQQKMIRDSVARKFNFI